MRSEGEPASAITSASADRWQPAVLLGAAGAMLLLGCWLEPSPRGLGTHEQLGLPACFFLQLTGIPCPHCGLTTSFAHATRLHLVQSFLTQPFGLLVFLITVTVVPFAFYSLVARVPLGQWTDRRWKRPALYALAACYLLGWVYKIAVT